MSPTDNGQIEGRKSGWKQDPEAVKKDILRVAREIFAEHGLSGARIQEIAERTATSKRMIFYYFGDKEGLYQRVLEDAYQGVREGEANLALEGYPAEVALAKLVAFTFDHHRNNPDFIRLVMIENIHRGIHLVKSKTIRESNSPAVEQLEMICKRGRQDGIFREEIGALELHWHISALAFFNISNQSTFAKLFGDEMTEEDQQNKLKIQAIISALQLALRKPETAAGLVEGLDGLV